MDTSSPVSAGDRPSRCPILPLRCLVGADPDMRTFEGFGYILGPGSPYIYRGDPALEEAFGWHRWYPDSRVSTGGRTAKPVVRNGGRSVPGIDSRIAT